MKLPHLLSGRFAALLLLATAVAWGDPRSDAPVFYTLTVASSLDVPSGNLPGGGAPLAAYYHGEAHWSMTDDTGTLWDVQGAIGALDTNNQNYTTYSGTWTGGNFVPFKTYTVTARVEVGCTGHFSFHMDGVQTGIVYINGRPRTSIDFKYNTPSYEPPNLPTPALETYTFTLRIDLPGNFMPDLQPDYLPAGAATSLSPDGPVWYLGLGRMRDGSPAGVIGFRQSRLDASNLFTPAALYYASYYPDIDGEVQVLPNPNAPSQFLSREALVNVVTIDSTSYRFDVYSCKDNAVTQSTPGAICTFTGSPFVSYLVAKTGTGGLRITRTEKDDSDNDIVWETSLEQSGAALTLKDWHVQGASTVSTTTTNYTTNTTADVSQTGPASGVPDYTDTALAWTKAFSAPGGNLIEKQYGASETTPLVTRYNYYDSSDAASGAYEGQLRWSAQLDGTWLVNRYYVGTGPGDTAIADGQIKTVYRPWLDGSPTAASIASDPTSATSANSARDEYTYTYLKKGNQVLPASSGWLPASIKSYAPGGTLLKQSTWTYNGNLATVNGRYVWSSEESDASDASHSLVTTRKFFVANSSTGYPGYLDDKPFSTAYPDGRKDTWAYFDGTWDAATHAFTASTGGPDRLVLVFHGQQTAGTHTPAAVSVSAWSNNGVSRDLDPLYLLPTRSTVSESVVDRYGRPVFSAENIYTTTGALERISGMANGYDAHCRLTDTIDVIRSVGTTHLYARHRTYLGALLASDTAPDGVETTYAYDDLLRQTTRTIGAGGASPYPEKVQTFKYDGANRPVAAYTCSCGTAPTIYYYDSAGRISQQSDPSPNSGDSLTTTYTYSSVTSTTTTGPDGATTIKTAYADGRPKSVTGTAQAPVYYDYAANATGLLVTRKNGSDKTNGWVADQSDLLGRVVKHSMPAFGWDATTHVGNVIDLASTYDPASGLLTRQRTTYGTAAALEVPDHLYGYDEAGRLTQDGLDVNADGALTAASNDRYVVHDGYFAKDTAGWRSLATTTTYATLDSATATVAHSATRLTGFNGGAYSSTLGFQVAETVLTDADNQESTQVEWVDPAARKHHVTISMPGTSNAAYSDTVNGYAAESQTAAGARTKTSYDALGRAATVNSRWNGAVYAVADTLAYYGNTKFVATRTVNGIATDFAYAWDPTHQTRTVTTTDAADHASYTLYNAMGLAAHVGGEATSPIEYSYDALGRLTAMKTWRDDHYTEATWPSTGGDTTSWTVDPATGLGTSKTFADGHHVDYTYTALGQPATRAWARTLGDHVTPVTTTYSYFDGSAGTSADVSHRTQELKSVTYNDGTSPVAYTYRRSGLPATVTDATGERTFAYATTQPFRVTSETLPAFYGSRVQTQGYDSVDRPAGFQLGTAADPDADLAQTIAYQATTGLPDTLTTAPAGQTARTFTYAYTTDHALFAGYATPVTGGSFDLTYGYQAATNLRSSVTASFGSATIATFAPAYNDIGQIETVRQGGTAFSDYYTSNYSTVLKAFAYDSQGQLQSSALYRGSTSATTPASADELPGRRFEYRCDAMGNRTSAGETGDPNLTDDTYTPNQLNQYASRTNKTVRVSGTAAEAATVAVAPPAVSTGKTDRAWIATFDPGQASAAKTNPIAVYAALPGGGSGGADVVRTDTSKAYFIPPATQTFSYDADGNLTDDGVWTYAYDAENRLTGMTTQLPAASGFTRWNLAFTYDYLGRRVQKAATNLDDGSKSYTRRYVYNGWNLVAELDSTGTNLLRSYTWGLDLAGSFSATGGVGALLEITDHTASKNYFAAYDHNGNVAALVRDDGTLAAAYEYSPFGEPLRAEVLDSDIADNPFRFSTKYTDVESGLVYYGFRYYSPSLGRFINRDPIEEAGGINLYGFVGNDPVNRLDRLGLKQACTTSFLPEYDKNGKIIYKPHVHCEPTNDNNGSSNSQNPSDNNNDNNNNSGNNPGTYSGGPGGSTGSTNGTNNPDTSHRRKQCQEYLAGLQQAVHGEAKANAWTDQLNGYKDRVSNSFNNGQDLTFAGAVGAAFTDIADFGIGMAFPSGSTKILAGLAFRTAGLVNASREGDVVGAIAGGTLSLTSITLEYGEIATVGATFATRTSGFGAVGALGISLYSNIAPYFIQNIQERSIINGINDNIHDINTRSSVWIQSESYYRDMYNNNHCSDFF
jgi:RHS repeat-associated protein